MAALPLIAFGLWLSIYTLFRDPQFLEDPVLDLKTQPPRIRTQTIAASSEALNNPFVGWAPWANNLPKDDIVPHSLVFAIIPWSMVEPSEGVYDFSEWEESVNFDFWSSKSVRFILRPVLDYPGAEKHMDIPQWLYDKMIQEEGTAGQSYEISYGIGFCPNYSSPTLIEAHRRFLSALGERYNASPNVAFIQIGSVGHWGEWHVKYESGLARLPASNVTDQYVQHYIDSFPDKMLLMRRPFPIAQKERIGLYDDNFLDDTSEWLDWIENGYTSDQTDEQFPAMPDYWKSAPAGGEFGSGQLDLTESQTDKTVSMIREAHLSFLGPRCPLDWVKKGVDLLPQRRDAEISMRLALGYRLRVDKVQIPIELKPQMPFTIKFIWKNDGNAPFYYSWPIRLFLYNTVSDATIWVDTDWDIRTILLGESAEFTWECDGLLSGTYKLGVAVFDPHTNEPGIYLAQEQQEQIDSAMNYILADLEIY